MKLIPTGLQQHLDTGATTMCYCWRITRKDTVVMGFTEHDNDLTVDGTLFTAETGFNTSRIEQALGLAVDNLETTSAFSSDRITEEDMIAGVYDDAFVEVLWVNWADPLLFTVTMTGNLGEVTQKGIEFTAELRSLTHRLSQSVGRYFLRTCDAVFCDVGEAVSRCKLDRADHTYPGTVVSATTLSSFIASGLAQATETFNRGVVTWLTGDNAGATYEVRGHVYDGSEAVFDMWSPAIKPIQPGDTFNVLSGCKQTRQACEAYNNIDNFRGFPHMPGKDIVTTYPTEGGEDQDGGALVF